MTTGSPSVEAQRLISPAGEKSSQKALRGPRWAPGKMSGNSSTPAVVPSGGADLPLRARQAGEREATQGVAVARAAKVWRTVRARSEQGEGRATLELQRCRGEYYERRGVIHPQAKCQVVGG